MRLLSFSVALLFVLSACGEGGLKIGAATGGVTGGGSPNPSQGNGAGSSEESDDSTATGPAEKNGGTTSGSGGVTLAPLEITARGKYTYFYLSASGVNLFTTLGADGVVTGYGTGAADGSWAAMGGEAEISVVASGAYTLRNTCLDNEVGTGLVVSQIRCTPMLPGLVLGNRTAHTGPWGHSVSRSCPAGKVLSKYNPPTEAYVVNYECANIMSE